ncbi:hypothetical protein [Xanthomonas hydrangeae]|uniref:hypothetical protein n=1 Tax=Xanthomonas hydrangeae TaxID=2775159 RepID=UPI00196364ED
MLLEELVGIPGKKRPSSRAASTIRVSFRAFQDAAVFCHAYVRYGATVGKQLIRLINEKNGWPFAEFFMNEKYP